MGRSTRRQVGEHIILRPFGKNTVQSVKISSQVTLELISQTAFRHIVSRHSFQLRNGKDYGPVQHDIAAQAWHVAMEAGEAGYDTQPAEPVPMLLPMDELIKKLGRPGAKLLEFLGLYFPKNQVESWSGFLQRCWTLCHHNRPTAKMLLNHPFLFGVSSVTPRAIQQKPKADRGVATYFKKKKAPMSLYAVPAASVRSLSLDAEEVEGVELQLTSGKRKRSL